MARQLSLGGEKIDLTLRRGKNAYEVAYGDDRYQVSLVEKGPDRYLLEVNGVISPVYPHSRARHRQKDRYLK